jgi:hypothetical protein
LQSVDRGLTLGAIHCFGEISFSRTRRAHVTAAKNGQLASTVREQSVVEGAAGKRIPNPNVTVEIWEGNGPHRIAFSALDHDREPEA